MAFSFGGAAPSAPPFGGSVSMQGGGSQVQMGPDLEEIQAEGLGFLALSAERKLRLLPTPWSTDALPPPTASLLSIASAKGLVAAAGPDALVLASTDALRAAFTRETSGDVSTIAFDPQLKIPMQMRISQVTFSSDDQYLVISAEQGGGLAVYEVEALMQGNISTAFELPTNGTALRALSPNPMRERAELFAAVGINGDLMMANLKERRFLSGPSGPVLKQGVSCVSWSTRGKQLVAGLGDGTAYQMTPEGEGKAELPRPPGLDGSQHVSSLSWLDNNLFLVVHTSTAFDPSSAPSSTFHLLTRQPPSSFVFQKLADPCPPYGLNRSPPSHFVLRLRDFPPSLQDILVISSTASTDVGLMTRAKAPLASDVPAEKITGVFTATGIANDSRRAQLPMTDDMNDTSPIGMTLDLSSRDPVLRPIVGEEIENSPTPLPAMMMLNNEGVIVAWWVIYSESIRQGIAYPGLVAAAPASNQASTFGTPSMGKKPAAFASPTPAMAPSTGAFGTSSGLGSKPSPWASAAAPGGASTNAPTFGAPAFGSSTPMGMGARGAAFGSASVPGGQSSPWSTTSASPSTGSAAFGQTATLGMRTGPVFGGGAGTGAFGSSDAKPLAAPSSGGFGSYANQGGFAAAAAVPATNGGSIFGKQDATPASGTSAVFGTPASEKPNNTGTGVFGSATQGFTLNSSFKGDGTAKDDAPKPNSTSGTSLFGSGFGAALGDAAANGPSSPQIQEADMDSDSMDSGIDTDARDATVPVPAGKLITMPEASTAVLKPMDPPLPPAPLPPSPKIKPEPRPDDESEPGMPAPKLPDAPLPPDTISKTSFAAGDSSSSAATSKTGADDAPLPPDFIPAKLAPQSAKPADHDFALPSTEDDGLDEEGSGVDVAQDLSPVTESARSPKMTPQSSFGGSIDRSPLGGSFTKVGPSVLAPAPRPLFGEISNSSIPYLPPPSRVPPSPRSPSPVRPSAASTMLRPDPARSVSAPGGPTMAASSRPVLQQQRSIQPAITPIVAKPLPTAGVLVPTDVVEEEQGLSDTEDEQIRRELATEVKGTTSLEPFLAHQDYIGHVNKPGIPGQIERLYRDINSMIDTLGLNARSLKSFIKGHSEQYKDGGRAREDLEDEEDWCLIEIDDLGFVENDLADQLEEGRVRDVQGKIDLCLELQKDLARVRAKHHDLKKMIDGRMDPSQAALLRSAPLSSEQTAQQNELRRGVTHLQKALVEAEESISVLKAKLATHQQASSTQATPTVDAVLKTIQKMTSIAEQKSGDIDVLENQMRKLRVQSAESEDHDGGDESSMFATPRSHMTTKSKRTSAMSSRTLFFTPESHRSTPGSAGRIGGGGFNASFRSSLASSFSASRGGTPSRTKALAEIGPEDVQRTAVKTTRKKAVSVKLRAALLEAGPRVRTFDG
ncbi:MAG: hypothetical protein M1838_000662 [Thelocarpon superellum]|nr:MAG: hypothetical protein M1838_000662 [Thelocarpon superellum]